jgi:hypothetical protein
MRSRFHTMTIHSTIVTPRHADLYDALCHIGNDTSTVGDIPMHVVDFLVSVQVVKIGAFGRPYLTPYGEQCYVVIESGEGRVMEFE